MCWRRPPIDLSVVCVQVRDQSKFLNKGSNIGSVEHEPLHVVRDMGVQLDDELGMKQHVNQVSRTCFHLLRRLHQVRRQLGLDFSVGLVVVLIWSRLDCCNSLFAGCQHLQLLRYKESRTQMLGWCLV
jgi:hypothetical protein